MKALLLNRPGEACGLLKSIFQPIVQVCGSFRLVVTFGSREYPGGQINDPLTGKTILFHSPDFTFQLGSGWLQRMGGFQKECFLYDAAGCLIWKFPMSPMKVELLTCKVPKNGLFLLPKRAFGNFQRSASLRNVLLKDIPKEKGTGFTLIS